MNTKTCKICNKAINSKEPVFRFPILPSWHELSRFNGLDLHIHCIKAINTNKNIGTALAEIKEATIKSKDDKYAPFIIRDGNIILQALLQSFNLSELEIYNYEDFIELEIFHSNIKNIKDLKLSK